MALRLLISALCALLSVKALASDPTYFSTKYLVEGHTSLAIENVVTLPESAWLDAGSNTPNLGFLNKPVWFRTTIPHQDRLPSPYIALVDYSALDQLELYVWNPETQLVTQLAKTGDHFPFATRQASYPGYAFEIKKTDSQSAHLYFRIDTTGAASLPLSLHSQEAFAQKRQNFLLLYGVVLGGMVISVFYNFLVFLRTREKLFLGFSCFAGSLTALSAVQSGLAYQTLWPTNYHWNETSIIIAVIATGCCHLLFSVQFLAIRGRMKTVMLCLFGINLAGLIPALTLPYEDTIQPALALSMIISGLSFLVGFALAARGSKKAKIYLLAWSTFLIGVFISASVRFGWVPHNQISDYAGVFGALTTVIILSSAIADIINREKIVRFKAQQSAISSLAKYETLYHNSLEGLFESSLDGRLLGANLAFASYLGYRSVEDLISSLDYQLGNLYVDPKDGVSMVEDLKKYGQVFGREVCVYKKDGSKFWASVSLRLNERPEAENRVEGAFIDISERKASEEKLKYLATRDPLTNLWNRRYFEQELQKALDEINLYNRCSLFYMDLDQFKLVNDTCGHSAGDMLLKQLARLMSEVIGERGTLARLGGDEFGLLVKHCSLEQAQMVGHDIMELIKDYRFYFDKKTFSLGISIGLVELSHSTDSIETAMSLADTACYAAKDTGRNRIHVYTASNIELQQRRNEMELASCINNAIEHDQLVLYKQLIVANDSEQSPLGYEVMIRMRTEDGKLSPPNQFIPAAERFDLMPQVDRWVIEKSFLALSRSPSELAQIHHCSINLSGHSLGDDNFKAFILEMFDRYSIPYRKICFEITESSAIQRIEHTMKFVGDLRALGCYFSLDDFGSGFSSYGYLKALPVDFLKIDGSFVSKIHKDPVDYAMVKSIRDVAFAMGMKTIAEYVENEAIVEQLKEIGVDYLQGYHIGEPEPLDEEIYVEARTQPKARASVTPIRSLIKD